MEDFQLTYGQNAVSEKIPPCKVVSVTGHRDLESRFSVASLQNLFDRLVAAGADTFCIGMARGFDLLCGRLLCEMKERIPLKLVACIPCADQSDGFCPRDKSIYEIVLSRCDEKIVLYKKYEKGCMLERNRLLVKKCDVLVAYLRKREGGTFYTVNYAEKLGKPVLFV